jgi:hypothetical protein
VSRANRVKTSRGLHLVLRLILMKMDMAVRLGMLHAFGACGGLPVANARFSMFALGRGRCARYAALGGAPRHDVVGGRGEGETIWPVSRLGGVGMFFCARWAAVRRCEGWGKGEVQWCFALLAVVKEGEA